MFGRESRGAEQRKADVVPSGLAGVTRILLSQYTSREN